MDHYGMMMWNTQLVDENKFLLINDYLVKHVYIKSGNISTIIKQLNFHQLLPCSLEHLSVELQSCCRELQSLELLNLFALEK